jgi:hypothetical protein
MALNFLRNTEKTGQKPLTEPNEQLQPGYIMENSVAEAPYYLSNNGTELGTSPILSSKNLIRP